MKHARKVNSFVIDRRIWLRPATRGTVHGYEAGPSVLLNDDGKMCCMGIYGKACGLSNEALLSQCYPDTISERALQFPKFLLDFDCDGERVRNELATMLAHINDNRELAEAEKEKKITKLFAKHNVKVKFIN